MTRAAVYDDFDIHHSNFESFNEALRTKCPFCLRLLRLHEGKGKVYRKDGTMNPDVDLAAFVLRYRMSFENKRRTIIAFRSVIHVQKQEKGLEGRADQFLFLAEGL